MEQADDIEAIAIALDCPPTAAQALLQAAQIRDFPTSTTIAHQGDAQPPNWLILDGALRCEVVSSDGRMTVVATHLPGDLIGGFGSIDPSLPGSLVTFGDTRLLTFPLLVMERLARDDPAFALAIARRYARQVHQLTGRLAARISLTAPGRVAARLLELAGPQQVIRPGPRVAALAIAVQTTRETASRSLSTLERRGIIARGDGCLTILSPRMLEEMIV